MISTDDEVQMGRKLAKRVKAELNILEDEPVQERVRTIGARLAAVCDRRELLYEFAVVHDDETNAFALPGGYVFVNDGLITQMDGDDELAAVIAHEIGHISARHAVKQYEMGVGAQLLQLAAMAAGEGSSARGVGVATQAARLSYAREDELQADRLGVRYMKAAGFDPTAALRVLKKLEADNAKHRHYLPRDMVRPQYAMNHPYVPDRIRAVKEALYGVADYVDYLNSTN